HRPGIPGPVEEALDQDLEEARASGDPEAVVRLLVDLAATTDDFDRCCVVGIELLGLDRRPEALIAFGRVIELDPKHASDWNTKGVGSVFGVELDHTAECNQRLWAS